MSKQTKTETLPYDGIDKALAKLKKEGWVQTARSFNADPTCCDVHLERVEVPRAPAKPKTKSKKK
jgi:hypothetical protein